MGKTCERCGGGLGFWAGKISGARLCKECNSKRTEGIKEYERKLQEFGEDHFLSREEERELSAIRNRWDLTDQDIIHTAGQLAGLRHLSIIHNSPLPVLECNDIILKRNEVCHGIYQAELVEQRTKSHYVGGSRGVSVRIAKGLSYHVGGFKGQRITEEYNDITDSGTLIITSQRIVFAGMKKTVSYDIKKLMNITKYENAIQFQKENETKPKYFKMRDHYLVDEVGIVVSKLVEAI